MEKQDRQQIFDNSTAQCPIVARQVFAKEAREQMALASF